MKTFFFFIVLITLGSCNGTHEMIRLKEKDNGSRIKVSKAEVFELALEGHPTAGYWWHIVSMDSAIVQEVSEQKYEPESKRLGSPGKQVFKFIATDPGETQITLHYNRPWEKDTAPLDTYQIVVKVSN
ncbi:MAG: protease inhibitor I42 family protein [candidate division KSB1 bacterium]|jgi:inhibitor of cysteine peptidase|nr:protease inhibitor I42 family protein [candidate division KSB1 bacterium]